MLNRSTVRWAALKFLSRLCATQPPAQAAPAMPGLGRSARALFAGLQQDRDPPGGGAAPEQELQS